MKVAIAPCLNGAFFSAPMALSIGKKSNESGVSGGKSSNRMRLTQDHAATAKRQGAARHDAVYIPLGIWMRCWGSWDNRIPFFPCVGA